MNIPLTLPVPPTPPAPPSHTPADAHAAFAAALDDLARGGRGSTARVLDAVIARHGDSATPVHRAFGAIARGSRSLNTGHYDDALAAIIPALEELERSAFSGRLAWLHNMVGFAVGMLGNPERGLEWTARAVAGIAALPPSVDSFAAYSNHGCLLGMVGAHGESRAMLDKALAIAHDRHDAGTQYIALCNIAYGLIVQLQSARALAPAQRQALAREALQCAQQARSLQPADDLGLDPTSMDSLLGQACVHAGDLDGAAHLFTRALQVGPQHPPNAAGLHLGMAMTRRLQGDFDRAREHLKRAHAIADDAQLGLVLDAVLAEGIELEAAAGDVVATLDWTTRRCTFLETHFRQRLQLQARSTDFATQADAVLQRAAGYQQQAAALSTRAHAWDDAQMRDPLTQAYNDRGLARMAQHVFALARPVAVVVVAIDDFADLDAQHGRTAADAVTQQVAAIIRAHLRSADQFARTDGGEFQLLLLDTEPAAALATCEQLRIAIAQRSLAAGNREVPVTASIGVCNRVAAKSFEGTLAAAERALGDAKRAGRNRTAVA